MPRLDESERREIEWLIKSGVFTIDYWKEYDDFIFCDEVLKVLEKGEVQPGPHLTIPTKISCLIFLYLSFLITPIPVNSSYAGALFVFFIFVLFGCSEEINRIHAVVSRDWKYCQEIDLVLREFSNITKYSSKIEEVRKRIIKLDNHKNILNMIFLISNAVFFFIFLLTSVYIGYLRYILGNHREAYLDVVLYSIASTITMERSINLFRSYTWKHWRWLQNFQCCKVQIV